MRNWLKVGLMAALCVGAALLFAHLAHVAWLADHVTIGKSRSVTCVRSISPVCYFFSLGFLTLVASSFFLGGVLLLAARRETRDSIARLVDRRVLRVRPGIALLGVATLGALVALGIAASLR